MQNTKISIIIPVYNGSNFMREAIDSALAQTYKNIEIIVINDGSKDNGATEKIAKHYGAKIRYFKKKNGGVATALNLGIEKMTGEYFSWLSHDDVYLPNKIESQADFIVREKIPNNTILYSDTCIIDSSGREFFVPPLKKTYKGLVRELIISGFLDGCSLLVPKIAFKEVGSFNPDLKTTQDYDLWFRFAKAGFIFKKSPGVLVKSRQHAGQDSVTKIKFHKIEKEQLYIRTVQNFTSKQIFGSAVKAHLEYLELSSFLKANGYDNASRTAQLIGFSRNSQSRYWNLLKYGIYRPLIIRFSNIWSSGRRFLKRKFVAFLSYFVLRQKRYPYLPVKKVCLVGDINSCHNHKFIDFLIGKYQIHFISTRRGYYPGIKIYEIAPRKNEPLILWYLRFIKSARKIIHQVGPDILHAQSLTSAGVAAYLSGYQPYSVSAWGTDVLDFDNHNPIVKILVKNVLKHAKIIFGSSLVLKDAMSKIGADMSKFRLLRFGIDTNIFKPKKNSLRKQLNIINEKIIFSPRDIGPIYNTLILVKAFEILSTDKKLKLFLVDIPVDQDYYLKLKRYINAHNLSSSIVFLPAVGNNKMAEYYNMADLVVSISSWDSASVAFLEAMACQKKIVVSDIPFTKEWARRDNRGRLVNFWKTKIEVDNLSKTIKDALNFNDKIFISIGKNNRKLVQSEADLKNCFEKIPEYYNQILE
jgi:glycosyltransferase involved in cell wall biosynthesis